jgi:cation diffusion facilitator CzcD-associated flavoprotein CzcO
MGKPRMTEGTRSHYEVIVVGAGVAGIYQIKRLADLGVDALVLDAAPDLGGTWYWNRYPGARFDSESYTYGYSFSRELLDEWHWKERFSAQPENLRYLNYVADKFDLRKYMQFNCKVEAATFDEAKDLWRLKLDDGRELTCRFVILAIGLLSTPTLPRLARGARSTHSTGRTSRSNWPARRSPSSAPARPPFR